MFRFWFEYFPPREGPNLEHQIPTSQVCVRVSLDSFAEMAISYSEVLTDKKR